MTYKNDSKFIIGLVGFRCCGKSKLREILTELNFPVFNTNSVKTGDDDEHHISIDETLKRYGKNTSYLLFLEEALKSFIKGKQKIIFIDSFKISADVDVMKIMFPNEIINIWYLHSSKQTRQKRYFERDVKTNFRTQNLDEHDTSLERHGIWNLIKSATEIINMEKEIPVIKKEVQNTIEIILRQIG